MKTLNVLVIGTGMYVCGRGTDGYGTIMPALCEWKKQSSLGEVYIAGTGSEGVTSARIKIQELQQHVDSKISVKYFPERKGHDPQCYKEAIRKIKKPACAIVVVPDNLHRDVAASTIEGGLHTLVVKPLASTLKEAQELIELQKKKQIYCAVEFHKRLDYANLKLKDAIQQGAIGEPLYFLAEYSQRKSIPLERFKKWISATNVFQYLGIHYVDIIYFATGAMPKRAMAIGQKNWLISKGVNVYDAIQGIIEWEMPSGNRFTSYILTSWIDPETNSAMSEQKIKVIGTKGRLESDQKRRGIMVVTDEKGIEEPNPYFCMGYGQEGGVSYKGYGIDSIHQFLKDVIQIEKGVVKINDLEDKRPTFKQSITPTKILEGIDMSLKNNGRWVDIK